MVNTFSGVDPLWSVEIKGLSTPVSEAGYFVSGNKIACFLRQSRRFWQQVARSRKKIAFLGNKIA